MTETIEKIGENDGISHYTCQTCGTTFGIGGKHEKPPACPYEPWHSRPGESGYE